MHDADWVYVQNNSQLIQSCGQAIFIQYTNIIVFKIYQNTKKPSREFETVTYIEWLF